MNERKKSTTRVKGGHKSSFSLGWSRGSPNAFMGRHVDLSDDEYARYKASSDRLALWDADCRLFELLARNHEEYRRTRMTRLRDFAEHPSKYQRRPVLNDLVLEMNRLVVNYVFSLCLYIEHMGQMLKERSPGLLEPYEAKCSALYDENFAYRFLVRLRNYVAHHRLPIGTFQLSAGINAQGNTSLEMRVLFDRDTLLEGKPWGQMRADLESMPAHFSVDEQLSSMMNCMVQLKAWIEQAELAELMDCVRSIEALIEPVRDKQGNPTIFENFDQMLDEALRRQSGDPDVGDSKIGVQVVPMDLMSQVRKIAEDASEAADE